MRKNYLLLILLGIATMAGVSVAQADTNPLHNTVNGLDVDGNTLVQPRDALLIINHLQAPPPGQATSQASTSAYFWDTNSDTRVTPIDALLVINHLSLTPEPSTMVSAGLGVMLLAGYVWRRRRLRS